MDSTTRRQVSKTPARGTQGMVVSHNAEAANVGLNTLQAGGNAFDAAIAMSLVTCVREVPMNSIGGVGVALVHSAATGITREINFYGRTPAGLHAEVFVPLLEDDDDQRTSFGWRRVRGDAHERGPLSVGVPTYVAGLHVLHRLAASQSWEALFAPAIRLAEQGFAVHDEDAFYFASHFDKIRRFDEFRRIFLADGLPMPEGFYRGVGTGVVQTDLAATLREVASTGIDSYHHGDLATRIATAVQEAGGVLATDDLRRYRPDEGDGLRGRYRDYEIVTSSGCTGGVTLLEMLNLAEAVDLGGCDRFSADCLHLLAEVMRQAWIDRFVHVGDPDAGAVPLDGLVDKDYAANLAERLDRNTVPDQTSPGDPWPYSALSRPTTAANRVAGDPGGRDTTHLAVADRDGNFVTLTTTLGLAFGSAFIPPSTGVLLYDMTMWMNPVPGTPNSVGPWKRQLGHATPVVVLKDGEPVAVLGAPGGRTVVTAMFQVIVNMVDFGMDVQQAIGAPRIHLEGADPSAPYGPTHRRLLVDDRVEPTVLGQLARKGHEVDAVFESSVQSYLAKPLGIERRKRTFVGGVDVHRRSVGMGW